mgnify:CR=1 FL=1
MRPSRMTNATSVRLTANSGSGVNVVLLMKCWLTYITRKTFKRSARNIAMITDCKSAFGPIDEEVLSGAASLEDLVSSATKPLGKMKVSGGLGATEESRNITLLYYMLFVNIGRAHAG